MTQVTLFRRVLTVADLRQRARSSLGNRLSRPPEAPHSMVAAALICAAFAVASDTVPVRLAENAPASPSVERFDARRTSRETERLMADSIVVDKSDRKLTLFLRGRPVRTYGVSLGRNPVGNKQRQGDGRTPEGLYYIEGRNPRSKFHLSLRVSYPTREQRERAARLGVKPGGDIMIHGLPDAFASVGELHRQQDWTEGCVAVTNEEIEEIWGAVPNGAKILIRP
jgi:murein L,D-transpeptidase YafK